MFMQVVSQDHFAIDVVYAPGRFSYSKETVGTRYVFLIIRTLANPEDSDDVKAANALQDAVAEVVTNTMPPAGLEVSGEPLVHFSGRQDVLIWSLERV